MSEVSAVPIYLDCAATTPLDPAVFKALSHWSHEEFGNAGSRTHAYGSRAKRAVTQARGQIAAVAGCRPEEVVFTSGATEANNLAILGLESHGREKDRRHLLTTALEHKAVLEPFQVLGQRGFEIEVLQPEPGGWVAPEQLAAHLRPDTLLVSIMHVNNETGVRQPIPEFAEVLQDSAAYFHVDGAQGFGKIFGELENPRIDFMSLSGHKIFGPKGIGALVARRRGFQKPPLQPLMFGGGQERGLRPGTLPVASIVGLGLAAELAHKNQAARSQRCADFRDRLLLALAPLKPVFHGDRSRTVPHILNLSFPGLDSEAAILALKDLIAVSNGSACTSQSYEPSHVLTAMGLTDARVQGAVRLSWCHGTADPDWGAVVARLVELVR